MSHSLSFHKCYVLGTEGLVCWRLKALSEVVSGVAGGKYSAQLQNVDTVRCQGAIRETGVISSIPWCVNEGYIVPPFFIPGYFGLGNWTSDGCIQCLCSGHSSNCSSSPLWYRSVYRSYWDLLTGPTAMQDRWTAVSGSGQSVAVKALTKITPVEAE